MIDASRQMQLPDLLPANDNDRRHNWHVVKFGRKNLAFLYIMEAWCYNNIGSDLDWEWTGKTHCSFWRFKHAHDFMMFELTWG